MSDPFDAPARPSGGPGVTLSDFLSRFAEVDEEPNGYAVPCPSHADTNPSLRVGYNATEKKLALKCRAGCSTDDVVEALGLTMSSLFNVEPGDLTSVRSAGRVPEKVSVGDRAALKLYLQRASDTLELTEAARYANARFGITLDKFTELGLGFDDGTLDSGRLILSRARYHDAPRLVVPFLDFAGHPHYLQARDISGTASAKWSGPVNPEGAAWGKYGFFRAETGWADVLICEGPSDALTVVAVGYDVVGVRGASLGSNPALADELAAGLEGRRVVVAGDSDSAGQKFTREVALALSSRGLDVHRLVIPDGVSDIAEWRESLSGPAFGSVFAKAVKDAPRYGSDHIVAEEIAQDLTRMFSDVYNAKALLSMVRQGGGDVRFTREMGFIVYRPEIGVWRRDDAEWVRSCAQQVAPHVQKSILSAMSGMDGKIAAIEDREVRTQIGDLVDKQRKRARSVGYVMSTKGIDSMLRELRALPDVPAELADFDQHHDLLAVRNGVVNLETGVLTPYSEETKALLLMRYVGTDYRPGARNPRWERFLDEVFQSHPGLAGYLQRLVGYGITGYTSEQCFGVLYGTGANGKSVLTDTLATIFDGVTATAAFETFEAAQGSSIRSDIARLNGARLVLTEEGKQGAPMAENTLKLLTGQGKVTTRFLYKEEFEFHPSFLILMASNYRPHFRGQDEGIWRRVRLIPFDRFFAPAERDKYLAQKFAGHRVPASAHLPGEDHGDGPAGILAWAVRGAQEWYVRGLQDPPIVVSSTEDYRRTSDALGPFYAEYLVKDEGSRISGKDVWGLYREWADEEDLPQKERWTRKIFWQALEERGAVRVAPGGTVFFKGIRRRRPTEHAPEIERASETPLGDLSVEGGTSAPSLDTFIP